MGSYNLSDRKPGKKDITHVKRLLICLKATGTNPVENLVFSIFGYQEEDKGDNPGYPVADLQEAEKVIQQFIDDGETSSREVVDETPLDFSIKEKCFIVLKLVGDFWAFKQSDAVTVKSYDNWKRYYNPRSHKATNGTHYVGLSFCSLQPLKKETAGGGANHRHGINLKVRFQQQVEIRDRNRTKMLYLPVIIDPDIENKGGDN